MAGGWDIIRPWGTAENGWPNRGESRSWLTDRVVPTLRWALGDGEPLEVGKRPDAVVAGSDGEADELNETGETTPALALDKAAIEIAPAQEEIGAAVASQAVKPKKALAKTPALKAPKKSRIALPTAADEIFAAAVEAASPQAPRP
jgi:hypothetical protein